MASGALAPSRVSWMTPVVNFSSSPAGASFERRPRIAWIFEAFAALRPGLPDGRLPIRVERSASLRIAAARPLRGRFGSLLAPRVT